MSTKTDLIDSADGLRSEPGGRAQQGVGGASTPEVRPKETYSSATIVRITSR
jgi:hypothetical protein